MRDFQRNKPLLAFLVPLVLIGIFTLLCWYDSKLQEIPTAMVYAAPIKTTQASYYPQLISVLGNQSETFASSENVVVDPIISAYGAVVIDDESKVMLYGKNEHTKLIPASTTKMMTALVGLDYFGLDDVLEYKNPTAYGSLVGLTQGEKMTFRNLLYGLLLPSGNDAAYAIAQNAPGGMDGFVAAMNAKAKALHMENTYFVEPSGISDRNLTTPFDLSILGSLVMQHPILSGVVGTKHYVITDVSGKSVYPVSNINQLLGIYGIDGVKTGFTEEAGGVLVTSRHVDGHRMMIVVMHSNDRFADTQTLVKAIAEHVIYQPMHP